MVDLIHPSHRSPQDNEILVGISNVMGIMAYNEYTLITRVQCSLPMYSACSGT